MRAHLCYHCNRSEPDSGTDGEQVTGMADRTGGMAAGRARMMMLTGTDKSGIRDRYDEIVAALERKFGRDVPSFRTMGEATAYLMSCGLFDPSPAIGILSCEDAVRSGNGPKATREEFEVTMAANPNAMVVAMLGKKPGRTAAETDMSQMLARLGAKVESIDVPFPAKRVTWLLDYADRHGVSMAEQTARTVIECIGENDLSVATELVSSLGNELDGMRRSEILALVPVASESTYTRMRRAIVARDANALRQCRRELPEGKNGDRTFVTKSRYAVQKLLVASGIDWSRKDLLAHGKGSYGDSYASNLMSEAARSGGQDRYSKIYARLCSYVTTMTGFSNQPVPDFEAILATLLS